MAEQVCKRCGREASNLDALGRCVSCATSESAAARPREPSEDPDRLFEDGFEEHDPLLGRELGGCRLLRRVGGGGMGTVYRAQQLSLGRDVAIKVISADHSASPKFIARLRAEARLVAALNHPNILQVYDVGSSGSLHFIIMEFVEGPSLGDLIFQGIWENQLKCRDILAQTLLGLGHAHDRNVIHRDLKPDNILLADGRHAKLADFGLAKLMNADERLTATGVVLGTPLYMSPEAAYGRPLDQRSDIYSLGATFYHALSGTPPFSGETAMGILYRHIHDTATPLTGVNPSVDAGLAAVLSKMLAKNPEDRFQTCDQVLRALDDPTSLIAERSALALEAARHAGAETEPLPVVGEAAQLQSLEELDTTPLPRDEASDPYATEPLPPPEPAQVTIAVAPRSVRRGRGIRTLMLLAGMATALGLAFTERGHDVVRSIAPSILRLLRSSGNLETPVEPGPIADATPESGMADTNAQSVPTVAPPGALLGAIASAQAVTPGPVPPAVLALTPVPTKSELAEPTPLAPANETDAPATLARDMLEQFAAATDPGSMEALANTIKDLAHRTSDEERKAILGRLAYLSFLKARDRASQALSDGKRDEARAAMETFRASNPESTWSEELNLLYTALHAKIEETDLGATTNEFLSMLTQENWTELAFAFPAKRCKFPSKPNAKKVSKAVAKALHLPSDFVVEGFTIETLRVDPDGLKGWTRLLLNLRGQAEPHSSSVLWQRNCGKWRLEADPLDRGLLGLGF